MPKIKASICAGPPQTKGIYGKHWTNCTSSNVFKEIFEVLLQAGSIGTDRAKCAIYEMSHNRAYSQWLSLSASQLGLQHMVQQTETDAMNGSIYILYCEHAHPVQIDEPFG